ncbi:MAG: RnfH family protein [Pseudomonadota bacterium]|nr:RnfH family protein [Pseudomonadota bacterium]
MAHADVEPTLSVSVVYSPRAGEVDEVSLRLVPGSTVTDALRGSGLAARHPGLAIDDLPVGIWGNFCARGDLLRDGDRVELYRPLRVDPKESRRRRQQAQGKAARPKPR